MALQTRKNVELELILWLDCCTWPLLWLAKFSRPRASESS